MTPFKPGKRLCDNTDNKEFRAKRPFVAASASKSKSKTKSKRKSKDDSELILKDKENDLV